MPKRLSQNELVALVENVMHPKGKGFSTEELNQQLLLFAINCPDPVAAMDLFIAAPRGTTAIQVVEKALTMLPRDPRSLPESKLAATHPLRRMTLE